MICSESLVTQLEDRTSMIHGAGSPLCEHIQVTGQSLPAGLDLEQMTPQDQDIGLQGPMHGLNSTRGIITMRVHITDQGILLHKARS